MGNPGALHRSVTLQALTIFSLIAVFAAGHVQGADDGCTPFSCGHLQDISYPFCRQGDPRECGVGAYELGCTSSKATIHINTGTYYVTAINYTGSYFWVMDANLDTNSSCPLPLWNHLSYSWNGTDSHGHMDLATQIYYRACFANCSRAVTNNSAYKPVACLSVNNSHVYVWVTKYMRCRAGDLEPYCGYLAMIPFGDKYSFDWQIQLHDASYADITELISRGFTVQFPVDTTQWMKPSVYENINICLNDSTSYFKEQISGASILKWARAFFWSEIHFYICVVGSIWNSTAIPYSVIIPIICAIATPKFLFELCRFLLAPLAVWIFLAYKYWKTRITIDAVEKFLRIQ